MFQKNNMSAAKSDLAALPACGFLFKVSTVSFGNLEKETVETFT